MKLDDFIHLFNVNTYVKIVVNIDLQTWYANYKDKVGEYTLHYATGDDLHETVWLQEDATPIHLLKTRDVYNYFKDKLKILGVANDIDDNIPVLTIECDVI